MAVLGCEKRASGGSNVILEESIENVDKNDTVNIKNGDIDIKDVQSYVGNGNMMIGNPWKTCDLEEILANYGWKFGVPEKASELIYRCMRDGTMAEMQFILDEVKWTARMKKGDALEDISGMYYSWDKDGENEGHGLKSILSDNNGNEIEGEQHILSVEGGTAEIALWYYAPKGLIFSLSCLSPKGFVDFGMKEEIFFGHR